jgi:hypothetical protein
MIASALPTSIPWWMGVGMVGAWLALVAGIVMVARTRRRLARANKPTVFPPRAFNPDGAMQRGLPEETGVARELGSGITPDRT